MTREAYAIDEYLEMMEREVEKLEIQHEADLILLNDLQGRLEVALEHTSLYKEYVKKIVMPGEELDLNKCPGCGGPPDNGHDRCVPPSPYYCTKCEAEVE